MALDQRLLEILVCPSCRGPVAEKKRRKVVLCTACGLQYPVRDGIPVMLVGEAIRSRGPSPSSDA